LSILVSCSKDITESQTQSPMTVSHLISESPLTYLPKTLVSLSLYNPNIQDSRILSDSIESLKNLEQLSLYCVTCLNDETLIRILETNGANLTLLNLGSYMALPNKLSDSSIKHIAKNCKNLKCISFDMFSHSATLESLQSLFESDEMSQKFELINLSVCRSVSYNLLLSIAFNCTNLKHLDLSGLRELVDDNLVKLIAKNMSKLEYLDLKSCTKVTDDSIVLLAIRCPLNCLVLSGLSFLTDKSIFAIANHLQSSLNEIYLSGCLKISPQVIRYLRDCCVNCLYFQHKVPGVDPNQLMAKNLDTGHWERVDLFNFGN
jgi:hypothetical protein